MKIKRLAHIAGSLLAALSILFILYLLSTLDFTPLRSKVALWWLPLLLLLAALFSLSYLFLALGWRRLLELTVGRRLDMAVAARYLTTVVFKYAPGNVFHFLGRHALKESHALSHGAILFANGAEILLQLFSVSLIILAGVLFFHFPLELPAGISLSPARIALAFVLLLLLCAVLLYKKSQRAHLLSGQGGRAIAYVVVNHLLFLLSSTTLLFLIYLLFFDLAPSWEHLARVVFVGSIAWLLGFVVPGAPGGIGIREAVLLFLLPQGVGLERESVLAGALLYRLVTIAGEAATLLLSRGIERIMRGAHEV